MKRFVCSLLAASVLVCVLTPPVNAQMKQSPQMAEKRGNEQHPEIRTAIEHLEQAKRNLENAAHEFGGHRSKALQHVNQALQECREALNFDKK